MKITKKRFDLIPGTMILHKDGFIIISSEYDSFHGWYECHETEIDDEGNIIETDIVHHVTPADLIGDEIE